MQGNRCLEEYSEPNTFLLFSAMGVPKSLTGISDMKKEAQEVVFYKKNSNTEVFLNNHLSLEFLFISSLVYYQVHFHNSKSQKKTVEAGHEIKDIGKYCNMFPCQTLIAIYKSFVRPHLNYGGIIYVPSQNERRILLENGEVQ